MLTRRGQRNNSGLPPAASCCSDHSGFYLDGFVCLPSPATFQIHFQVNTAWPATNLQPTGVVTAVADNGKSKLQPGSGMFTVTTGKLAANIFPPGLSEGTSLSLLILFWWITWLTLCFVCVQKDTKGTKGATFLTESFHFSQKKPSRFERWNLKLTHSCQQLQGVWKNVIRLPLLPSPCTLPKKTSQSLSSIFARTWALGSRFSRCCAHTAATEPLNFLSVFIFVTSGNRNNAYVREIQRRLWWRLIDRQKEAEVAAEVQGTRGRSASS